MRGCNGAPNSIIAASVKKTVQSKTKDYSWEHLIVALQNEV